MNEGAPVEVGGETLYALPVKFQTDGDGELLETHGIRATDCYVKPLPELDDEEMLALLYGLLIFPEGAEILQQMSGFGATQVRTY